MFDRHRSCRCGGFFVPRSIAALTAAIILQFNHITCIHRNQVKMYACIMLTSYAILVNSFSAPLSNTAIFRYNQRSIASCRSPVSRNPSQSKAALPWLPSLAIDRHQVSPRFTRLCTAAPDQANSFHFLHLRVGENVAITDLVTSASHRKSDKLGVF